MAKKKQLRITLVRSSAGRNPLHIKTLQGLGLRKINQVVELQDTPSVRGMVNQISYLLNVEEL